LKLPTLLKCYRLLEDYFTDRSTSVKNICVYQFYSDLIAIYTHAYELHCHSWE